MISVQNVNFKYENTGNILTDISFEVEKGKTCAIVGVSGCGKSTLLRLIAGFLIPSKGHIALEDLEASQLRKAGRLSFMFQDATLLPHLNVRQNVKLPLNVLKDKIHIADKRVDELIDIVGLSGYEHFLPKELSGGMKTRTALARNFVNQPDILLLDEPFSALDISWKKSLYWELFTLKEKFNSTIVIVTHDIEEAILLSDYIVVLGKGGYIVNKNVIEYENDKSRIEKYDQFLADVYDEYIIPTKTLITQNFSE